MRRASQKHPRPRKPRCAAKGAPAASRIRLGARVWFGLALGVSLVGGLGGCGWGARLRGDRIVLGAVDFQEALWACGRIELPRPSRRAGDFGTVVGCVDAAEQEHRPDPRGGFSLFARELRARYRSVHDLSWGPELALEVEVATRAALRRFWEAPGGERLLAPSERESIVRHFPQTAWEMGWAEAPVRPGHRSELSLERLRARLAGLEQRGAPRPQHCRRLRELRAEAARLGEIGRDLAELAENAPPSGSPLGFRQWERYLSRVETALNEAGALRREILSAASLADASDETASADPVAARLAGGCPARAPDA
jgi:hypothetical protein